MTVNDELGEREVDV